MPQIIIKFNTTDDIFLRQMLRAITVLVVRFPEVAGVALITEDDPMKR